MDKKFNVPRQFSLNQYGCFEVDGRVIAHHEHPDEFDAIQAAIDRGERTQDNAHSNGRIVYTIAGNPRAAMDGLHAELHQAQAALTIAKQSPKYSEEPGERDQRLQEIVYLVARIATLKHTMTHFTMPQDRGDFLQGMSDEYAQMLHTPAYLSALKVGGNSVTEALQRVRT